MNNLLKLLLAVIVFATLSGGSSADTITWSASPPPTGNCVSTPERVKIGDTVTFAAQNLEDLDTKTTISGCESEETLVADSVGGNWMISQPGVEGFTNMAGVTVQVTAEAWEWSPDDDTGAIVNVSGLFTFDDGRGGANPADPRHDTSGLAIGAASTDILIPDDITTSLQQCMGEYPVHAGSAFIMSVRNSAYPTFSFNSMTVKEEILYVICDVQDDPVLSQQLISGATDSWTIGSAGTNAFRDIHSAGDIVDTLFDLGNTSVTLTQIYRITSGGWPAKNPNHAIGQEGGLFGALNALHSILYTRERVNPKFCRVTKDGVTCQDNP